MLMIFLLLVVTPMVMNKVSTGKGGSCPANQFVCNQVTLRVREGGGGSGEER